MAPGQAGGLGIRFGQQGQVPARVASLPESLCPGAVGTIFLSAECRAECIWRIRECP